MILLRHCISACGLFLLAGTACATDVDLIGLFPGKAVVVINDGAPRTLSAGKKTPEGVTLLSTDHAQQSAVLEIDGQKKTLKLSQHYSGHAPAATAQSITLMADPRGHFIADGQINGGPVRFLVDTGATMIAISSGEATRLGIDYRKGRPALMNTANGTTMAYQVKLDTVRVGDVTMNDVDAAVLEGNALQMALLGMSFLNSMEMKRDGQTMVLTRRF